MAQAKPDKGGTRRQMNQVEVIHPFSLPLSHNHPLDQCMLSRSHQQRIQVPIFKREL